MCLTALDDNDTADILRERLMKSLTVALVSEGSRR